jgi:hypothetical protein
VFDITFNDPMNSGTQNLITVDVNPCTDNGCRTISNGIAGTISATNTVTVVEQTAAGADNEASVCSNRGTCDTESGLCSCFGGYKGISCQKQSTFS